MATMIKQTNHHELVAAFTRDGFRVEAEPAEGNAFWYDETLRRGFKTVPFKTLYAFGFSARHSALSMKTA
jgi:hypothetical protein